MDQVPESRQPGGRNAIAYTDSPMYLGAGSRGGLLRRRCSTSHAHRFCFAVTRLVLATTPTTSGTYTRKASYASLRVTHFVAQQWNLCSPPQHTHTHTHKRSLCFSMLASFPGLNSFLLLGERLETRLTLASYPGAWVRG